MSPSLECDECGAVVRRYANAWSCQASCCAEGQAQGALLCRACWPPHYAQYFLDAHGVRAGELGPQHREFVALMALFRDHR